MFVLTTFILVTTCLFLLSTANMCKNRKLCIVCEFNGMFVLAKHSQYVQEQKTMYSLFNKSKQLLIRICKLIKIIIDKLK